jgi:indoleamine 2,3-dioxygenase
MRKYMPQGHRRFIEQIESTANIRDYVQGFLLEDDITAIYNLAVSKVASFGPSRRPLRSLSHGMNLAIASSNRSSRIGLFGTGGTDLMPFLKQNRDETRQSVLL